MDHLLLSNALRLFPKAEWSNTGSEYPGWSNPLKKLSKSMENAWKYTNIYYHISWSKKQNTKHICITCDAWMLAHRTAANVIKMKFILTEFFLGFTLIQNSLSQFNHFEVKRQFDSLPSRYGPFIAAFWNFVDINNELLHVFIAFLPVFSSKMRRKNAIFFAYYSFRMFYMNCFAFGSFQ